MTKQSSMTGFDTRAKQAYILFLLAIVIIRSVGYFIVGPTSLILLYTLVFVTGVVCLYQLRLDVTLNRFTTYLFPFFFLMMDAIYQTLDQMGISRLPASLVSASAATIIIVPILIFAFRKRGRIPKENPYP